MMKGIVVYDSWTGNTRRIAEVIASGVKFNLVKVNDAPLDLREYEILVLGTPNIRAKPSEKILDFMSKVTLPTKFAVFVTFGMPIWGVISSIICLNKMRKILCQKGSKFAGQFMCPGFHVKYKTYKGKPSEKEFRDAREFSEYIIRRS